MKPTAELLIGSPLFGAEACFLTRLVTDILGQDVLILANFEITKAGKSRQIDFVVVTNTHTELLEHKALQGPIIGTENGPWKLTDATGQVVSYPGENPWLQASQAKYLLSDLMFAFSQKSPPIPGPLNRAFYKEFDASVCIYPQIDPASKLTKGNFKAYVRGYSDCLSAIKLQVIPSSWKIPEWRRFAIEALRLRSVTLLQAIDQAALAASDLLDDYRKRLSGSLASLPPLQTTEDEDYGERLVTKLLRPENILLLGPSGCGKSYHLRHLLNRLVNRNETPILVQAKHYAGLGISNLIQRSVAVHYRGAAKDFLETCNLAAQRIVLIVDAVNECPTAHLSDLSDELKAFVVQSQGRLVVSGHDASQGPSNAIETTVRMKPLTLNQKKAIYACYARTSKNIDHLCVGFTNAYDLSLAGQCHEASPTTISRVSLYERYCRKNLPKEFEALSLGFLRTLAASLERSLSFSVSRDEFDRLADGFMGSEGESLKVLDKLRESHLLEVTDETVSFEHELLFMYFRAEHLRRICGDDIDELERQIRRPIYQELFEFILPRLKNESEIGRVVWSCTNADVIDRALRGGCGDLVRRVIEAECSAVIDAAVLDLQNINLIPHQFEREDGTRSVAHVSVEGNRCWSPFELLLFTVLARNLTDKSWADRLLGLYYSTEQALHNAALNAAKREKIKFKAVWRETVRCLGHLSGNDELPALRLLKLTKMHQLFISRPEDAATILDKAYSQLQGEPEREFSLLLLLYGTQELCHISSKVDVDRCIELLRISFSHSSPLTRIDALHLFRTLEWHSVKENSELRARIRAELQKLDTSNPFVNTDLIAVLGAYDGMEPIVSAEQAQREFRQVLYPDAAFDKEIEVRCALTPEYNREQMIAEYAHSAIANIFEDVYAGVYFEAYESLSAQEKTKVLCMAGAKDCHGTASNWILAELSRTGDPQSLPVFMKYARKLHHDPFVYDAATDYLISIMACAKFMNEPPEYQDPVTPSDLAWSIVGQVLFWHMRLEIDRTKALGRIHDLWVAARGTAAPAIPDVLRHLGSGIMLELASQIPDLLETYRNELRTILEEAIAKRQELCSLIGPFSYLKTELVQYTMKTLGAIGNESSVLVLQPLVDDPQFGRHAVDAIFQIRRVSRLTDGR
jgi:energy-coupling factor transporter ATP-binding protein EcfA2